MDIEYVKENKLENIRKALSHSGFFLESRILETLDSKGYNSYSQHNYPDLKQERSRQISIYSEAPSLAYDLELNQSLHINYQHRLIIESLNNDQPLVFMKKNKSYSESSFEKFYCSKIERTITEDSIIDGITPDFQLECFTGQNEGFHYNNFIPNSQYCSFSENTDNNEKPITPQPTFVNHLLDKMSSFAKYESNRLQKWLKKFYKNSETRGILFFPVLIIQNELLEVTETNGKISLERKNHIVYEYKDHSNSQKSMLIDIITESYLSKYLKIVHKSNQNLTTSMIKFYKNRLVKLNRKIQKL